MEMVGMILDVFPSYKDKDMVDLLYQYERDTRLSLNILVENFLEQKLHEEGYRTIQLNDKGTETKQYEIDDDPNNKFTVKKQGDNLKLFVENFYFGVHPPELVEEIKNKLKMLSDKELTELSKDNWDGKSNISYRMFLCNALEISTSFYLDESAFVYFDKNNEHYRVSKCDINFGSSYTFEQAKKVRDFLAGKNWDEQYATKNVGLRGKKYREWIFSEIEKEEQLLEDK